MQEVPSVVDVSRQFVILWQREASWEAVQPYFDCVFNVVDERAPAGPGPFKKP
jgi:hypothetical protein